MAGGACDGKVCLGRVAGGIREAGRGIGGWSFIGSLVGRNKRGSGCR